MSWLRVLFVCALFLLPGGKGYSLDWQGLHGQADATSLPEQEAAVRDNPDSIADRYLLGLVYLASHRDQDAQKVFQEILGRAPDTTAATWGLAECLRRQHRHAESERLLRSVLEKDARFAPAYISLAYLRYVQLDFNGSVALAYKVLDLGRGNVDSANYTRAYLLVGGGRGMLAHYGGFLAKMAHGTAVLSNLKKAEAIQPGSAEVLFGLGTFYFLAPALAGGDRERARAYLERAVVVDPLLADAYVRLAQLYGALGEKDRSRQMLERAEEIDPRNELLLDFKTGSCKFICTGLKE